MPHPYQNKRNVETKFIPLEGGFNSISNDNDNMQSALDCDRVRF